MRNIVLVTLILFFVACSSSDDAGHSIAYDDNFAFAELTNGAVNIPHYSGGRLFLLLYNIPSVKTETYDGGSVEEEPNVLTVTGVPPQSDIPELPQSKRTALDNDRTDNNIHDAMRSRERELLASGLRQYGDRKGRNAQLIEPKIFNIGDSWEWYVSKNPDSNYELVASECKAISAHAYFFIETGINISAEYLEVLKAEYDEKYELMHEYFGEESDVDENGKIIIVITKLGDEISGYFYPNDKYSKTEILHSNEADIFYVNSQYIASDGKKDEAFETMVHEFQHMIYFDNAYRRDYIRDWSDIWLNEALSMLSEYICGYSDGVFDNYIGSFLYYEYRNLSLTGWTPDNYGYSSIFTRYIYERFGAEVIKRIYSADVTGYRAVEIATGMDFNELFKDFAIACAISDKGILNDKIYNFDTIDFTLYAEPDNANLSSWLLDSGMQKPVSLKPYSFVLIEILGTADSVVSDNFSGAVFRIKP